MLSYWKKVAEATILEDSGANHSPLWVLKKWLQLNFYILSNLIKFNYLNLAN